MSIERVAKYAGVSTATVSRVLNSVPVVSPSTVRTVQAAIETLNYDPLEVKRGPRPGSRNRRSTTVKMIAVVSVGVQRDRPRSVSHVVIESIVRAAKQGGMRVLLDEVQELGEVGTVVSQLDVQGMVVLLADDAPMSVLDEMNRFVPVVWAMGGHAEPVGVDHISENNTAIGYLAHQYLHGHGCRDMAFISTLPHKRHVMQRGQAILSASVAAGHSCRAFLVSEDPSIARAYGSDAVVCSNLAELIEVFAGASGATSPRPDGLFVDRDSTTARVQLMLMRQGIQPGRDLRIVSCDNDEASLSALDPRPASIDLGIAELGSRIVRRLALRIENRDEPPVFIQTMPQLRPGEEFNGNGQGL
jgi:DNA-binding LacI/PurR family transcriptional regulator